MIQFSYANPEGVGNRTAAIAVSQIAGTPIASPSALINGAFGVDITLPNENWAFVFDFGTPRYIRQWCVWATSTSGVTCRISGSNDNVSYTRLGVIDEAYTVDLTDVTKGNGCLHLPIIDNLAKWRYYKWERISGSGTFAARDLEFYIGGAVTGLPYPTIRYDGGGGDRTPIMVWSTNKTMLDHTPTQLGDGNWTEVVHQCLFDASIDTYIQWNFYGKTVINTFRYYGFSPGANTHGVWNLFGSNDGWLTSTLVNGDFGTPIGLTNNFDKVLATPNFYSSYRLQNVGGTGFTTIYVGEFEFLLAPLMDFVEEGPGTGRHTMRAVTIG